MHRPKARLAWGLLLAGQLLYVAGDTYTYTYPELLGGTVGFPSAGDAIYLTLYPVLFCGLFLLVKRRSPKRDRAVLIDSLILTVGFALLSWIFLVAPNMHLSGLSPLAKGVSVAYPLGDVLLLAAAIRLAVDAGKRAPAFYLLVASIVSLLATDCAYNYALLVDGYHHQLTYDIGWIAYLVFWGSAALHPSMRTLEEPGQTSRNRLSRVRLAQLALACLIAPAIHFTQDIHNGDVLVVIGASAGLFLLVVARMAGLVRDEERATGRELALRRAGVALVAAAGNDSVAEAVVAATREVVGPGARVRLLLTTKDEIELVASSDPRAGYTIESEAAGWLQAMIGRVASVPVATLPASRPYSARRRSRRRASLLAAVRPRRGSGRTRPPDARHPAAGNARLARLARVADLARARGLVAGRGSPPAEERGALPLARRARERPDHCPRRRRNRHLPEPVDRACARLRACTRSRAPASTGCSRTPTARASSAS